MHKYKHKEDFSSTKPKEMRRKQEKRCAKIEEKQKRILQSKKCIYPLFDKKRRIEMTKLTCLIHKKGKKSKQIGNFDTIKIHIYSIGTLEVTFFYRQPLVAPQGKGSQKASLRENNSKVHLYFAHRKVALHRLTRREERTSAHHIVIYPHFL